MKTVQLFFSAAGGIIDLLPPAGILSQLEVNKCLGSLMTGSSNITQMLREWNGGNRDALGELMPFVYDELHKRAVHFLNDEGPGHTLQATALIHETYIRLVGTEDIHWESRTHFFAMAATLMRRILIDYARAKYNQKRGGRAIRLSLADAGLMASRERSVDLMALDEALARLAKIDDRQARTVELRYFGGLSLEETAEALQISRTSVCSDWNMAKAWLHRELTR